jgi:hypothetical protein
MVAAGIGGHPPGLFADAVLDEVTITAAEAVPWHAACNAQSKAQSGLGHPGSLESSRSVAYLDKVKALTGAMT